MSSQTAPPSLDRKTWPYGRGAPVPSSTPEPATPVAATVATTVAAAFGCVSMEVIARAGMSGPARFSDHVAPPSRLRKRPPLVVPAKIMRGFTLETRIAEIGDLSNTGEARFQRRPFVSVDHRRAVPAKSLLVPLRVEGSMARTVTARWLRSSSKTCPGPGETFFQLS